MGKWMVMELENSQMEICMKESSNMAKDTGRENSFYKKESITRVNRSLD